MRSLRPERSGFGHLRHVGVAALIALSLGLVVVVVGEGFSTVGAVRAVEDIALGVIVAALLMMLVICNVVSAQTTAPAAPANPTAGPSQGLDGES